MSSVKTWNPQDVNITLISSTFGTFALTCLGEDDVECSKDNDSASASVGAQGDVIINESCDKLGTIKFNLQAQSLQLSTVKRMASAIDKFGIWVTNKSTGEKTGGSVAYFKKPADNTVGKNLNDRSFEVQVTDYVDA